MKKSIALAIVIFGFLSSEAYPQDSLAITYLEEKIAAYENRLQTCLLMGRSAHIPSADVLAALRTYPQEHTEGFLLARATLVEEKCVSAELGELASAVLAIEAGVDPLPENLAILLEEIKPAAFPSTRWQLQRHYLSLPADMRAQLEGFEAFQDPFNSLLIRKHLFH